MVFSDPTNQQGIVQDIDFLVNTDSVKFPIADKTRIINTVYDDTVSLILQADGRWQWDDTNYTDLPIASTKLIANQQDYSYAVEHLRITRMEIQRPDGTWQWLQPIDQNDERWKSITAMGERGGVPQYYDKLSNSVFLYPRPNYGGELLLKAYFQRNKDPFVATDTTKQPGFASTYHKILSYGTAVEYASAKGLNGNKIASLTNSLAKLQNDLKEFYSKKSKDEQVSLRVARPNNCGYGSGFR